jgi:hypothetical protein
MNCSFAIVTGTEHSHSLGTTNAHRLASGPPFEAIALPGEATTGWIWR